MEEMVKITEEIENYKLQVEANIDKKYELQSEINSKEINFDNYEKRQAQIKSEVASHISELDSTRLQKEEQEICQHFMQMLQKQRKNLDGKQKKAWKTCAETLGII